MKKVCTFVVIILAVSCGRIVRADTAILTILHVFGAATATNGTDSSLDGSYAVQPPVIGSDGNLYGTTYDGGTDNNGTVYMMTPQGTLTTLYSFQGYDGIGPRGLLIETNGLFYGTTKQGGANVTADNLCCGTIFTITPQGTLTTIHSFDSTDGNTSDSGVVPSGNGTFYGTTYGGGAGSTFTGTNVSDSYGDGVQNPPGTVYTVTAQGTVTTVHSFSGADGANPGKEAVVGTDGNVYGTTLFGGANNAGTVYTISSAGTFTLLYSFTGGDDGAYPKAQLVQGPDGNFYGTTLNGGGKVGLARCGSIGCGTVFKITPQGTVTTLHDFSGDPEPAVPGSLTLGPDGNYYGTSYTGGTNHIGTVFMITPEGVVTTLYQFGGPDGSYPIAGLTLAGDGSYYGATTAGGANDDGVIFQVFIDTNCSVTVSASSVTLTAKGGVEKLTVKADSDCSWSAATTNSFITITSGSGAGDGTIGFTVPGNTNTSAQVGTIAIRNQTITVNQGAGGCTFALSPKDGKFKDTGGAGKVAVTPNFTDCDWTAISNDPFITITAGNSGAGKGTVSYTVASNATTVALTGSITIGGQNFAIDEAAAPCGFSLGETAASFSSAGGTSNVTVTANGTNCTWKAVASGTFIQITSDTSGSGSGTVAYTVEANTKIATRKGTITVGKEKLTITQSGTP
jgi:uncharacterized repeat protein (TIGR03803 family)